MADRIYQDSGSGHSSGAHPATPGTARHRVSAPACTTIEGPDSPARMSPWCHLNSCKQAAFNAGGGQSSMLTLWHVCSLAFCAPLARHIKEAKHG